jgi:hypothetical protein
MKFKNAEGILGEDIRRLDIKCKPDGATIRIETEEKQMGKGLLVGIYNEQEYFWYIAGISRSKALKLAWAIIDELNPGYDTDV